jgi:hypothetical protein
MSFDLALWKWRVEPSAPEAQVIYEQLAGGSPPEALRRAGTAVKRFLAELLDRYPPMAGADEKSVDKRVWSVDPELVGGGIVLCVRHSKAAAVEAAVRSLAERHALICYDPQSATVYGPQSGYEPEAETVELPDDATVVPCELIAPLLQLLENEHGLTVAVRVRGRSWGEAFLLSGTIPFRELDRAGVVRSPLSVTLKERFIGCRDCWKSVAEHKRYKDGWP